MTRTKMPSGVPLDHVAVIKAGCANVGWLIAFRALNLDNSLHLPITTNIVIIQINFATLIALFVGAVKTKGSFAVISVIVHRSSCYVY